MKLEYKTKEDVMNFFAEHADFHHVHRISELLVSHQNVQEEEIKQIKQILHELKNDDYVIVENEGANIYVERFSSTPDRVTRFLNEVSKTKNYYDNKSTDNAGEVNFVYSSNNGLYLIGKDDYLFGIKFSEGSTECIHVYNDHKTIDSIAIVDNITNFEDFDFERKYDGTSRARSPEIGEIILIKNIHNQYALLKIKDIEVKSRGGDMDEVKFVYKILGNSTKDLIVNEAKNEILNNENSRMKSEKKIKNKSSVGIFAGGDIKAGGDIIVGGKNISNDKNPEFDHKSEVMKNLYWVGGTIILLIVLFGIYKITGVNLNTFK